MKDKFLTGKIPWKKIAQKVSAKLPPEVLLGPAEGEDAALIQVGGEIWAVASDPITFTSKDAGKLSVFVNANDVAVRGATPLYFTAIILISPEHAEEDSIYELLDEIRTTCETMGIVLIGGHTEVTAGLPQTIIAGTMLGKVAGRPITTGGLRHGDLIGMTKWAGLEGTTILLTDFEDRLRDIHGPEFVNEFRSAAGENWLSILPEAATAAKSPSVTSLHDITEGGIGEALHEMEAASGLLLKVDPESIPILPATKMVCADFGMNPFGLIGSGSLLIGCSPEGKEELERALAEKNVPFTWIGRALNAEPGAKEPGVKEPGVKEPATKESGVKEPGVKEAGAKKPAMKEPGDFLLWKRGIKGDFKDLPAAVPRFERDEILKARLLEGLEAVVFDMDGTVIHSTYDWAAMRTQFNVGAGSIIEHLNNLQEPERESRLAELREIERSASIIAHVKEGAADLLALLKRKGIKTALVTNNSDENAHYLIEKFGLAFDVVITRDSGLYKPSGAPVAEAVRRMNARLEKTLCVGDSLYDILACRDAGCGWVCILYDDKKVYSSTADLSFPDIHALIRYFTLAL
ncbi:MAG: HAD family hydrolase [Candidatus Abyssobacteria bacterium SURF_5]|uniref:HAD family hydrolase n=1 Tax=Abyssobacteria bacterium (strain SURF_5) TaxID=2093360 RepID=A0A3A4NLM3_ABYX5|nr:MAG: HAD family hydrolase [Candidatus Abyssubacteria bacterium SURF_5]